MRPTTSAQKPPADHTPLRSATRNAQGGYGSSTVAVAFLRAGSTRTIRFAFGTATQTAPGAGTRFTWSAQQARFGPTRIVPTTRFRAGSTREILGPPAFATHTAPGETAMPLGCGPARIVDTTRFTAGSMRRIVPVD